MHGHAPLRLPYQYVVARGVPIPKVEEDPRAVEPPSPNWREALRRFLSMNERLSPSLAESPIGLGPLTSHHSPLMPREQPGDGDGGRDRKVRRKGSGRAHSESPSVARDHGGASGFFLEELKTS